MLQHSVFWQALYMSGCEIGRLSTTSTNHNLHGTILFLEGRQHVEVRYQITCNRAWHTQQVDVQIENNQPQQLSILVDRDKRWTINGNQASDLAGCIDVDLDFTPVSNTLPVRRLALAVGKSAEIEVAWLKFPSLEIVRAKQQYQRLAEHRYSYFNIDSGYATEIMVDGQGFVTHYPDLWEAK